MRADPEAWIPFRREPREPRPDALLDEIASRLVAPLEGLANELDRAPVPPPLAAALRDTLARCRAELHAFRQAVAIDKLDQVIAGCEPQLDGFRQRGGTLEITRFGTIPDPDPTVCRQLQFVLREAVGNALRHSGADHLALTLAPWADGCALTLSDNGRGLPDDHGDGLGLRGMARRLERLGGRLKHHSQSGTTLEFRVPGRLPSLWDWLRDGGRLERGVAADHASALVERWAPRVDAQGSLEEVFRRWPSHPSQSPAPSLAEGRARLARSLERLGAGTTLDFRDAPAHVDCLVTTSHPLDPLHWLDLALPLAAELPLSLAGGFGEEPLRIQVAADAASLEPPAAASPTFATLVERHWSRGRGDLRDELAGFIHDHLAQELVAASMQWELASNNQTDPASREACDHHRHQLHELSLAARALSHELAAP